VLQELRETICTAKSLVAEIGIQFKSGSPAEELITQLGALLATLPQHSNEIPSDLQAALAELLFQVEESVLIGDNWLEQTGPELASQQLRQRLRRTYGVT
jgi:hypothetical protein